MLSNIPGKYSSCQKNLCKKQPKLHTQAPTSTGECHHQLRTIALVYSIHLIDIRVQIDRYDFWIMKKQSDLLLTSPPSQLDTSESSTEPTNSNKFTSERSTDPTNSSKQNVLGASANQLIVDFPASRLDAIDSDSSSSEEISKNIHRVQFSPTCSTTLVENTAKEGWYPEWSKSYFEHRMMFHARDMYHLYGNRPNDGLLQSPALALRYLGMEPSIFQDLLQCKRGQRKNHIMKVLQYQHTCSSDQLSELSEQSSEFARARATDL